MIELTLIPGVRVKRKSDISIDNHLKGRGNMKIGNIRLSDEQQHAVDSVMEFVSGSEKWEGKFALTLSGSAGTGKTMTTKAIVMMLKQKNVKFALSAPTHKAKLVLSRYAGEEAATMHSLFGLSPDLSVEDFSWDDVKFNLEQRAKEIMRASLFGDINGDSNTAKNDKFKLPVGGLLIIDECSMINDSFFKFIFKMSVMCKVKILFVGDEKQLQPVKAESKSMCFYAENVGQLKLTSIFRQDGESAVVPLLAELRDKPIFHFETSESERGSVYAWDDKYLRIVKPYVNMLKVAMPKMDTSVGKIICYTNNGVNRYNHIVRRFLFRDEDTEKHPYIKGEFLVGEENLECNGNAFFNSLEYVVAEDPVPSEIIVPFVSRPFNVLNLALYDVQEETILRIPIMVRNLNSPDLINEYASVLEEKRISAINIDYREYAKRRAAWGAYYSVLKAFASDSNIMYGNRIVKKRSFNYGYAITTYKSQGSGYTNVFIDMDDIAISRELEVFRQHEYVALSRTRKDAYIYYTEKCLSNLFYRNSSENIAAM